MSLLKDISVIALLVVSTAGISGWYTKSSLQVNQFIENTNNEVKLNSAAAATLKTESVSREFVEIIVKDLTTKVAVSEKKAEIAQVQAAQTQGTMQALSPIISSPELQSTLKTLASSPEAVSALNNVAQAVEEAKEEGDDGKTLELITRLDKSEETIKSIETTTAKLEALDVPGLIKRLEDLTANVPSLSALDEAIAKTQSELIAKGDIAIQKEVDKLSSKLSDQIISSNQPVNVRMGNAESSILSLSTKIDTNTTDINVLKLADISLNASMAEQINDIRSDVGVLTLNITTIAKQVVPVGGILCIADWLGATIESNFVRADGQTLSEPSSLFDGMTMPNLNVAQLWIRGGSVGGIFQDASIPLLGTVMTDIDFSTANISDGAFGTNHSVHKGNANITTMPIKLGDATELRVPSLSCVYYLRVS